METSYKEILDWLYGLQRFGIKLGLEKVTLLLEELENPQDKYPVIHIAGTNGKGSVASMISAVLQSAGLKVGLYTSPHLVRFTERMRINGKEITEEQMVVYAGNIRKKVDDLRSTFFEATTAIAFKHFADQKIDVAVIETGMGGRFDATNVVNPLVTVITNIGLEHQKYLGRTIPRIAYEKGGIIKPGTPVVSGVQNVRAVEVLQDIANFQEAPFVEVTPTAKALVQNMDLTGTVVDVFFADGTDYEELEIDLTGRYQIHNLLVALRTIDVIRGKLKSTEKRWGINDYSVREGLKQVKSLTGLKGRLHYISGKGECVLDVAHNPGAMRELVESLEYLQLKNIPVVFGVLNDKDIASMFRSLGKIAKVIYLVQPQEDRAVSVEKLSEIGREIFFPLILSGTVQAGVKRALGEKESNKIILITGSHYVGGETLKFLQSA